MKNSILFLLLFSSVLMLRAQDAHFSQYYSQPLLLNPAATGSFTGDYHLSANYKQQWSSVPVPFTTFASSAEMKVISGRGKQNIIGVGAFAMSDKAGDSHFSTTQFGASFSYLANLDHFGEQYIGGGVMASYGSTFIDYTGLQFQDAYENHSFASQEPRNNLYGFFDASIGAYYSFSPDQRRGIQAGAAIFHVNEPIKSFFGNGDSKLYRKFVIHASGNYLINRRFDIYPKLYVALQGPHQEVNLGAFLRVRLDDLNLRSTKYHLYAGAWYRLGDALIPMVRMDIKNFSAGVSYDINLSKLKIATFSQGGPEFSLEYFIKVKHQKPGAFFPRF